MIRRGRWGSGLIPRDWFEVVCLLVMIASIAFSTYVLIQGIRLHP